MSETAEVPWDIQIQGRASGLWRRIRSQRNTLAGKAFTKPVVRGTSRQAIGHHMVALGIPQDGGYSKAGNHVLLHCPRTELVWDHAITLASAAVCTTPTERRWKGMASLRECQIGHLLSTREQLGADGLAH